MAWLYVGCKRADRFCVLCDFWTELLITVTMAVAARAPLSGKLPIHPQITDSDPASWNWPMYFGRGVRGRFVPRCVSGCQVGERRRQSPSGSGVVVSFFCSGTGASERAHWRRRRLDLGVFTRDLGWSTQTIKHPNCNKIEFLRISCYYNIKDAQLFPATPFWFLSESHSVCRSAFLDFLGKTMTDPTTSVP